MARGDIGLCGADLSVLPMSFVNVGVPMEDDQGMRMVDAQGERIH